MPSYSRYLAVLGSLSIWAGCDRVFGLGAPVDAGGAGSDTAIDTPTCSSGVFGNRTELPEFVGTNFYAPQLTRGGLELFLANYGTNNDDDLVSTTRLRPDVGFPTPAPVPALESSAKETEPSLSAEGLDIVFTSNRTGTIQVFEATRTSPEKPWSTAALAAGLEATSLVDGVELSADGLTLYFNTPGGTGRLMEARRETRDTPFAAVIDRGERFLLPAISTDQLEIFGVEGTMVKVRRRGSISDSFGVSLPVDDGSSSPDVSADGRTLIVKTGGGLAILQRDCP